MGSDRFWDALIDDEARAAATFLTSATGVTSHQVLVVLGSGLADALDGDEGWGEPAARLPLSTVPSVLKPVADGHVDELRSYVVGGQRVLVALGRTHLYEGVAAQHVTALSRAAVAHGVTTAVLCNANGCLRDWDLGDVMAIEDHLNFSGTSPFDGTLFLDTSSVWDAELSHAIAQVAQRRGVYALLRGPEYQTRAETRWLATTGADCVGMSTVMEALTLHALGVRVGGMSVVSDLSFAQTPTDPEAVVHAAARAGVIIRGGIEVVLATVRARAACSD